MITAETAKCRTHKGKIREFVKYALIHISGNIERIANRGGDSFELPLEEYTENRSLQEFGEFLILLGKKLQAKGYRTFYDYRKHKFNVTW